jgi:2-methylcitrate dehydratase PrpD
MKTDATTARAVASRLANLVYSDLPGSTVHAARRCIVDALGCAAAGLDQPAVAISDAWAARTFAPGSCDLWFRNGRGSALAAAFANATAASILDLDDGHRAASGHPGAAIVPAVLAEAQARSSSVEDMLLAIVAGYEAGVGFAQLRTSEAQKNVATGRWSTIGVAAAIAKLRGLSLEQTCDALTIAESHAPNLLAADHSGFQGGHVKEGIPWSVITGMAAADLAEVGFKGYQQSFNNPAIYRELDGRSAGSRFLIETAYFKRYACCRWTHSAIDAALALQTLLPAGVQPDEIHIHTFDRAATLPNHTQPADMIAAQFSLPFAVAAALVHGADALLPMAPTLLDDPAVFRLATRIVTGVDPKLQPMFPAKVPARVRLVWAGNSAEQEVISPLGDYDNPISDEALIAKAALLASRSGTRRLAIEQLERFLRGNSGGEALFACLGAQTAGAAH